MMYEEKIANLIFITERVNGVDTIKIKMQAVNVPFTDAMKTNKKDVLKEIRRFADSAEKNYLTQKEFDKQQDKAEKKSEKERVKQHALTKLRLETEEKRKEIMADPDPDPVFLTCQHCERTQANVEKRPVLQNKPYCPDCFEERKPVENAEAEANKELTDEDVNIHRQHGAKT